jgi:hypothetical protein
MSRTILLSTSTEGSQRSHAALSIWTMNDGRQRFSRPGFPSQNVSRHKSIPSRVKDGTEVFSISSLAPREQAEENQGETTGPDDLGPDDLNDNLDFTARFHGRRNSLNARSRILIPAVLLVSLIAVAGCKKKAPPPPPAETAPPTSVPAPTAQITIAPTVISAGDQAVLSWHTTDASNVSIDGIGAVPTSGVRTVTPTTSTSYHLMATAPAERQTQRHG